MKFQTPESKFKKLRRECAELALCLPVFQASQETRRDSDELFLVASGVVALTVKSSNVFVSNFLSIINCNREILRFLLPHSSIWYTGNKDIGYFLGYLLLTWLPSFFNTLIDV